MDIKLLKCGCAAQALVYINGTKNPPVPGCGLHGCVDVVDTPDLNHREARCMCGKKEASSVDLAFFEYRGNGSRYAQTTCKCGFGDMAHTQEVWDRNPHVCKNFNPRGAHEFDSYYCGCRGFD